MVFLFRVHDQLVADTCQAAIGDDLNDTIDGSQNVIIVAVMQEKDYLWETEFLKEK